MQLIGCGRAMSLLRCFMVGLLVASAQATELKANTAAAFDRYIRATEAQHTDDLHNGHFLVIDRLPDSSRQETYARLRQSQTYIEQLHTEEDGRPIPYTLVGAAGEHKPEAIRRLILQLVPTAAHDLLFLFAARPKTK